MKNKLLKISVITIVLGIIFGIHANVSTYMDQEGVLHENFSTPLSAMLILAGLTFLIIGIILHFIKKKS